MVNVCYKYRMQLGFYDLFFTQELARKCEGVEGQHISVEPLSKELFWHEFPTHVAAEVLEYLKQHDEKLQAKNMYETLRVLLTSPSFADFLSERIIPTTGHKLHGILPPYMQAAHINLPDTPLAISSLLTGAARTPKLGEQIKKELATCDRAEWMVSFIRMTGLVPLMAALEEFTNKHRNDSEPCLRIATTTYMGVTEAKAIEWLQNLPKTEVRVSYDTKNTRLHAKTYIFHRNTGFGSAYIGSSNISKVAMDNGLEWNVKISQRELAHLWEATIASFESHWEDARSFERCSSAEHLVRLKQALEFERKEPSVNSNFNFFELRPFRYQEEALEDIERERHGGKKKHLIVAATGTGKTMIAAFDYQRFCKTHPNSTLLFLAHRKEILEQAQTAFRQVSKNGSLGCIVDGSNRPLNNSHWFCTIQSWQKHKQLFEPSHFQYVVVDEAHHGSANSYKDSLERIEPESLLGLTATPERMDGNDIRPLFGGSYTHEIRLGDAIERTLLSPFVYYGISDAPNVDFSTLKWNAGKYDERELAEMLEFNEFRAAWVLEQMNNRLDNIHRIKCLGFCVNINHAEFMARFCNSHGVKAIALTSRSSQEERNSAQAKLQNGDVNIIFTVDMYNEGVDIPNVDTVLFLRPTESLTVFLQQLGRGLRRTDDKECLVVFDFIAQQHKKFNYAQRYRALCANSSLKAIEKQVQFGFSLLPVGCSIYLEEVAQKHILANIKDIISSMTRRKMEAELRARMVDNRRFTLTEIMEIFGVDTPESIYSKILPSAIQEGSEVYGAMDGELDRYEKNIRGGICRLLLQTDSELLGRFAELLNKPNLYDESTLSSVYKVLWGEKRPADNVRKLHNFTLRHSALVHELSQIIKWQQQHRCQYGGRTFSSTGNLKLHASYTRDQILLALGLGSFETPYPSREGVLHLKERKLHIFFADINKNEDDFSPTTMYEDYAISPTLFHWQSQSGTTPHSSVGQSYIHQEKLGYTIMLFIRERKQTSDGISAPYVFVGPATYVRHSGSKPMSIRWRLTYPLPAHIMAWANREN